MSWTISRNQAKRNLVQATCCSTPDRHPLIPLDFSNTLRIFPPAARSANSRWRSVKKKIEKPTTIVAYFSNFDSTFVFFLAWGEKERGWSGEIEGKEEEKDRSCYAGGGEGVGFVGFAIKNFSTIYRGFSSTAEMKLITGLEVVTSRRREGRGGGLIGQAGRDKSDVRLIIREGTVCEILGFAMNW